MDTFLEYLMEKKSSNGDFIKKLGIVVAAFVVIIAVMNIFLLFGKYLLSYIPLAVAAVVYGAYILIRNFNVEYEYIFTNGDLDIDIIKSRRARRRLASLNVRQIEVMAKKENSAFANQFESDSIAKKFDAVYDPKKGGIYCVLYKVDGVRTLLTFQPPERLIEEMKKMNPRAIVLD